MSSLGKRNTQRNMSPTPITLNGWSIHTHNDLAVHAQSLSPHCTNTLTLFKLLAPSTTLQLHYRFAQNKMYTSSAMQRTFKLYTTMKPWPKNTMMWPQIKWLITKNPSTCLCCALTCSYQYDGPWSPLWQDEMKLASTKDQRIKDCDALAKDRYDYWARPWNLRPCGL